MFSLTHIDDEAFVTDATGDSITPGGEALRAVGCNRIPGNIGNKTLIIYVCTDYVSAMNVPICRSVVPSLAGGHVPGRSAAYENQAL